MKKPKKRRQHRLATTFKEDSGKLLLDVGKLVFVGIVLGTVLRYELPRDILLTGGISAVIVLFIFGLILGAKKITTPRTQIKRPKRRKR